VVEVKEVVVNVEVEVELVVVDEVEVDEVDVVVDEVDVVVDERVDDGTQRVVEVVIEVWELL